MSMPGRSRLSDLVTFCSVSRLIICAVTDSGDASMSSALSSGEPTLMAMTTSGRHRSVTSAIGTLSTKPPSTRLRPSYLTGDIRPGTDMVARISEARSPLRQARRWPVTMSVVSRASGNCWLSTRCGARSARTSRSMKNLIFWPLSTADGNCSEPFLTPASAPGI